MAGLITCGNCGRNMQRMGQNRGDPRILCTEKGCVASAKYDYVEARLLSDLENIRDSLRIEIQQAAPPDISSLQAEQKAVKAKLKKMDARISTLHDLLEDGTYDRDTFKVRMAKAEAEKQALQEQQASVAERIRSALNQDKVIVLNQLDSVLELYPTLDTEGRNLILKSIIDHVVYRKMQKSKPMDFTLEIHLKDL